MSRFRVWNMHQRGRDLFWRPDEALTFSLEETKTWELQILRGLLHGPSHLSEQLQTLWVPMRRISLEERTPLALGSDRRHVQLAGSLLQVRPDTLLDALEWQVRLLRRQDEETADIAVVLYGDMEPQLSGFAPGVSRSFGSGPPRVSDTQLSQLRTALTQAALLTNRALQGPPTLGERLRRW